MDWCHNPRVKLLASQLWAGQVIAYPTEAVWGLGCDPMNPRAVERLLALKGRPVAKGLILVAANIEQFEPYLAGISADQRQKLINSWPGANTWLVPDNGYAPAWIRGRFDSVALRVSAHPLVSGLCRAFGGPLVSTSANPQGRAEARNAMSVRRYFGENLAAISPGVVGKNARPSQIRDLLSGETLRSS